MADLAGFRQALIILHRGLGDLAHPWAITGSLGFALQGMDTAVHGDDLLWVISLLAPKGYSV